MMAKRWVWDKVEDVIRGLLLGSADDRVIYGNINFLERSVKDKCGNASI